MVNEFLTILPELIMIALMQIMLIIIYGFRFSIKKTLLLIIPFNIILIIINAFALMYIKDFRFWYPFISFVPQVLFMILIGNEKAMSYIASGLNAFISFDFILLLEIILIKEADAWVVYLLYLVAFPAMYAFNYFFFRPLLDKLKTSLTSYINLLAIYCAIFISGIFLYFELIKYYSSQESVWLQLFSVALFGVYLISIIFVDLLVKRFDQSYVEMADLRTMKNQVDNIKEQYKMREIKENELKILRHDMKHILINISTLISNDKKTEALEFINEYVNTIDSTRAATYCNSPIINSILDYYFKKCQALDVILNIKINNIEEALEISEFETSVLISNLLDNAIKASDKLKNNRIVDFIFLNNNGRLVLQVKNNYDGIILIDKDGRPTNLAKGHGLGSDSIELFTKKYNLTINYEISENVYKITILF